MFSFVWNDVKAVINVQKHGVSFDEAKTVFDDPAAAFLEERPAWQVAQGHCQNAERRNSDVHQYIYYIIFHHAPRF